MIIIGSVVQSTHPPLLIWRVKKLIVITSHAVVALHLVGAKGIGTKMEEGGGGGGGGSRGWKHNPLILYSPQ